MEQAERGGEKRERLCCVLLYGCRGRLDSVADGAYDFDKLGQPSARIG